MEQVVAYTKMPRRRSTRHFEKLAVESRAYSSLFADFKKYLGALLGIAVLDYDVHSLTRSVNSFKLYLNITIDYQAPATNRKAYRARRRAQYA